MADSDSKRGKTELGTVDNLQEKKIRFVEHLITLGGLLAVFLGFNLQSAAINQPLVLMGTTFAVAALLVYTTLMFFDKPQKSAIAKILQSLAYALLSGSFGGIVFLAYAYAFTGAGVGNVLLGAVTIAVISVLFFVIDISVARILRLEEESPSSEAKHPKKPFE